MSDELTPDSSVPAPLVPAAPQYSSRREMRQAMEAAKGKTPAASAPIIAAPANVAAAAVAPAAAAVATAVVTDAAIEKAAPTPLYSTPKSRKVRLSMKDRRLARRLAVAPTVAATAPRKSGARNGAAPRKRQNPFKTVFVFLVIVGFVGGIALPAAAFGVNNADQATLFPSSAHGKQAFKSNATIDVPAASRDTVTATSAATLKAEQVASVALTTGTTATSPTIGARQPGDDYPWRTEGNSLSPLGYYYRQCVDFVAWRLNRDAGVTSAPWKWKWSNLTPNGGDASQWKAAWEAHGWTTSATPVVGSVAWFVGNHVAYVNAIHGSNVVIEEYNGISTRAYAMRTIPIDSVGRFLYPPPA